MEMPNFENHAERGYAGLEKRLRRIAEELGKSGIDVDDTCHLDMWTYRSIYGDQANKDNNEVKQMEDRWAEEKGDSKKQKGRKRITNGEKMEMFKTALFHKALGAKFYILRSSLHDDYKNGIDNVIADKESGAVVGAFDEVVAKNGRAEKESKVAVHNTKGGAFLKYGIGIENGQIVKQKNEHIPLFYLALGEEELMRAIESFDSSEENLSTLERDLLAKLAASVNEQTEAIAKIGMLKNKIPDIEKFQNALQEATNPEKN